MPVLESSAIALLSYNPGRRELRVRYRGGGDYAFLNVPPEEYEALMSAPSKGAYVNDVIKPRYRFRRLSSRRVASA